MHNWALFYYLFPPTIYTEQYKILDRPIEKLMIFKYLYKCKLSVHCMFDKFWNHLISFGTIIFLTNTGYSKKLISISYQSFGAD